MTVSKSQRNAVTRKRQMNRIRKWRLKGEDDRITEELSSLLKTHGDKILHDGTTLCLTTQVLGSLNRQFFQLTEGATYQTFQVAEGISVEHKIAFLFDFLQKVPKLKITSGPVCSPSPHLNLSYFKQVCYLEIKRIPVCYIKGLSSLRRQIKSLICSRSTNDVKTVVYQFGKENTSLFALTELNMLDLSYNTIRTLDESLRLLPALKSLNLSHNCLSTADLEPLPALSYLNLGYNSISQVPSCTPVLANNLTTLILRNNNLNSLEGIQNFTGLKYLDVSGNCIVSFDDLVPLAQLQRLVNINLQGNPLGFMIDYRANTIARLSPLSRKEAVYLDGKVLSPMEELCLGRDVEPVSLRAYIPSQPIGRPTGSLKELARSLHHLSCSDGDVEGGAFVQSLVRKRHKRRHRKFREAQIIDASTPNSPSASNPETPTSSQEKSFTASIGPIVSRRSSIDDSVIWVHPERENGMEANAGISALDYTSFDESCSVTDDIFDANTGIEDSTENSGIPQEPRAKSLSTIALNNFDATKVDERRSPSLSSDRSSSRHSGHGIYSSVPVRLNSLTSLDGGSVTSIDNLSEEEDEEIYLVQSVISNAKDRYGREEKESIFLLIKHPYIVERDPFQDTVLHKLDLNYLQDMSFHTLDPLRINLRFSLLRQDRKERVYIFEDPDNMQNFIKILKPTVKRNQDREFAELLQYQCLKCSTLFVTPENSESIVRCPTCGSDLVVEKEDNESRKEDAHDTTHAEPSRSLNDSERKQNVDSSSSLSRNSSIAIVVPFARDSTTKSGSLPASFSVQERILGSSSESQTHKPPTTHSVPKAYTLNMETLLNDRDDSPTNFQPQSSSGSESPVTSEGSALSLLSRKSHGSGSVGNSLDSLESISNDQEQSISTKGERLHSSRASSRLSQTSSKSSRQNGSKVANSESFATNKNISWNKDEFKKLDHRVMLYLVLSVLQDDEVKCVLRSSCYRYVDVEEFEALLVVSSSSVFIFRVENLESETPEDLLQRIAKHKLSDLIFVEYGYFNQSFRLDFTGNGASYKFLVRDSLRCERFLATFLCELENMQSTQIRPTVVEDPNPQTIANIRSQLFAETEDLASLGRRLFVQATTYCFPPVLKTKKVRMRSHENCFIAREFIDWLAARRTVKSKIEGVNLLQRLVNASVIQCISKDNRVVYNDSLYKFTNADDVKVNGAPSMENGLDDDCRLNTSEDEDEVDYTIVFYQLMYVGIERRDSSMVPRTLIMTRTHLFLADESHHWPLSRLSPPPHHLLDQFSKVDVQQVTNATKMELYEDQPCFMKIDFVDECSDDGPSESSWVLKSETPRALQTVSSAIRDHWKEQFTIDLPLDMFTCLRTALAEEDS